jgi:tetratricopeptide (TPR) repeat protein
MPRRAGQPTLKELQQALATHRQAGDRVGEAATLFAIGDLYWRMHPARYDESREHLRLALAIQQDLGDRAGQVKTLSILGLTYAHGYTLGTALEYLQLAEPIAAEVGDRAALAEVLDNIARMYFFMNEYEPALEYFHRAVPLIHEVGDLTYEVKMRMTAASCQVHLGDVDRAIAEIEPVVGLDFTPGGDLMTPEKVVYRYEDLCRKRAARSR